MWTYEQKTGSLFRDKKLIATGYSGNGDGKNNPFMQNVVRTGPLPCGLYEIGEPYDHAKKGPHCMRLLPNSRNVMFGRAGFLIHGDSKLRPGTASEGCIILPRAIREQISGSGDTALIVVSGIKPEIVS